MKNRPTCISNLFRNGKHGSSFTLVTTQPYNLITFFLQQRMSSCVEITFSLKTNCQWGGSTIFCFSTRSSPSVTLRASVADSDRGMFRWTHCWNFCFVTGGPPVASLSRFYRIVDIVTFSMCFTKQQILKPKKVIPEYKYGNNTPKFIIVSEIFRQSSYAYHYF